MLDFAEVSKYPEDYPLLLTMALTGLSRAEIVGEEKPRSSRTIGEYLRSAKTNEEGKKREENYLQLNEGKVEFIQEGRIVIRLSPNRKRIDTFSVDPNLPGLRIEKFLGDSIEVKERGGKPPHKISFVPFLSQKLRKFIGNRMEGRIFPFHVNKVFTRTKDYAKLAQIPFTVNPRMFEQFYRKYQPFLPNILGISDLTAEYVEARTKEETEEIEWKFHIDNPKEFCETMVSFANLAGGEILIGVDNTGVIQGVNETLPDIEGKITNFAHDWCDPHIPFEVSAVEVQGKTVVVVKVKQGIDKPYWLKEKGFVIRNGSSDRIMKRSEVIDELLRRFRIER